MRDFQVRDVFCGCGDDGSAKDAPALARSAFWFHGLTVPGVVRTPLASEGFGGADDGSEIAGVLQADGDEKQRRRVAFEECRRAGARQAGR